MSKYHSNTESDRATEATAARGVIYIANELAESNRLRKVTIELELIKLIDPAQVATFQFDKDEDLA